MGYLISFSSSSFIRISERLDKQIFQFFFIVDRVFCLANFSIRVSLGGYEFFNHKVFVQNEMLMGIFLKQNLEVMFTYFVDVFQRYIYESMILIAPVRTQLQ